MAKVKFNKVYHDKELGRKVEADEPVEMTLERADEVVKNIRDQKVKGYGEFNYERLDKQEEKQDSKKDKKEDKQEGDK
uniref:hypothetical protein n=1 Tax=uncultured Allobacillus sp. TaxID=1638025 RepID=UPI002596934B|nr:hypothetical protein [uncultured Allobacillus sp.]